MVTPLCAHGAGPQQLATQLGLNAVFACRLLRALRTTDPIGVVHRLPGPDPLRRLLTAVARTGADPGAIKRARHAVDDFETLIQKDIGDRSALDAIVSAWIPEASQEFQLRRRQSVYRALSQLRGVACGVICATAFLAPDEHATGRRLAWINGLLGVQRVRPNANLSFAAHRLGGFGPDPTPEATPTHPCAPAPRFVPELSSCPGSALHARAVEDATIFSLTGATYSPRSTADVVLVTADSNGAHHARSPAPGDRMFVYAGVVMPARLIQFDVFVHRDLGSDAPPRVDLYDTAIEGVADVNDPARSIDRLSAFEPVQSLGCGRASARSPDVPRYAQALKHVADLTGWDDREFRVFRYRSQYPLHGSQVVLSWPPSLSGRTPPTGDAQSS